MSPSELILILLSLDILPPALEAWDSGIIKYIKYLIHCRNRHTSLERGEENYKKLIAGPHFFSLWALRVSG